MADRTLGMALVAGGLLLGLVGVAWMVVNAVAGILGAGGFALGSFFLLVFIVPLVAAGIYLVRRSAIVRVQEASFERRRTLMERDRIFRQNLQREASRTADLLGSRAGQVSEGVAPLLRQTGETLQGVAQEAGQRVSEGDFLHGAALAENDARDVARYDDLLLAGLRKIRAEVEEGAVVGESSAAQGLLDLARSMRREFDLRQDLLLRGRRLPAQGPLRLLRAEVPAGRELSPETLRPGDAVSHGSRDYLVTAHISYFERGRNWHALVLRGEEGERRLQVGPEDLGMLLMESVPSEQIPEGFGERGTASVSVDSLSGSAEGLVVDYRLRRTGEDVGWWERWPEGERAYRGWPVSAVELEFWPMAVGSLPSL